MALRTILETKANPITDRTLTACAIETLPTALDVIPPPPPYPPPNISSTTWDHTTSFSITSQFTAAGKKLKD